MRYLLDTGPAQDYISHRRGIVERAKAETLRGNTIGICVPVLGELHSGVENSDSRERNLDLLRRALVSLKVWPYTDQAAEEYGRLHAALIRRGRPMQQIDIMVAAIARTLGNCEVVSKDSDLRAIPGLTVVDWSSP